MNEVENYELESGNVFMFFSNFFLLLLFISSLVFFCYLFICELLFIYNLFSSPFRACTKTYYGYRFCFILIWKVELFFGLKLPKVT